MHMNFVPATGVTLAVNIPV